MNEENLENNFHEHADNPPTNDQSSKDILLKNKNIYLYLFLVVVAADVDEIAPLQTMINQWNIDDKRLRTRASGKSIHKRAIRTKVKCDVCNKFYRADYMKVRLIVRGKFFK
jgi:hypothetical protein